MTDNSVVLSFTQVDDGTGQPANYAIGYGSATITSLEDIASTIVTVNGTGIGAPLEHEYTGLDAGTDYEFGVAAYRGTFDLNNGTFGELSNTVPATTLTPEPPQGTDEPSFGSNSADVLIWTDSFESYETTNELDASAWDAGAGDFGSEIHLDSTGGRGASNGVRMDIPSGTSGPRMERGFGLSSSHTLISFWFRFTNGDDPRAGKFFIVHHDQEGASGCGGQSILRYQFELARHNPWGLNGPTRFYTRSEENSQCDGPIHESFSDLAHYFTWDVQSQTNPRAPVMSTDPDIDLVPWNPINDGNWHRYTIEIKTGTGTNGYSRLWIDGHNFWDSSPGPMNFAGKPQKLKIEWVSGDTKNAATIWYDDITVWRR